MVTEEEYKQALSFFADEFKIQKSRSGSKLL